MRRFLPNDDELQSLAKIKDEAEDRLFKRVDFSIRMARVVYLVLVAVIIAALWLGALQWQQNINTRAVRLIWEKVYGYPLP